MSLRIKLIAPLALSAALLLAPTAGAATVAAHSGALSATLHGGTHHPIENKNWWITVTATLNGRPVRAHAFYQFLFSGQVVSTQYVTYKKNYMFTGHFRDNLVFPPRAVGYPLTVRVVVQAGGRTVYLPYAVQVVK